MMVDLNEIFDSLNAKARENIQTEGELAPILFGVFMTDGGPQLLASIIPPHILKSEAAKVHDMLADIGFDLVAVMYISDTWVSVVDNDDPGVDDLLEGRRRPKDDPNRIEAIMSMMFAPDGLRRAASFPYDRDENDTITFLDEDTTVRDLSEVDLVEGSIPDALMTVLMGSRP